MDYAAGMTSDDPKTRAISRDERCDGVRRVKFKFTDDVDSSG